MRAIPQAAHTIGNNAREASMQTLDQELRPAGIAMQLSRCQPHRASTRGFTDSFRLRARQPGPQLLQLLTQRTDQHPRLCNVSVLSHAAHRHTNLRSSRAKRATAHQHPTS
jgi:hypothetical protein